MERMLLGEEDHIVDRVIIHFQTKFDADIAALLDRNFSDIDQVLGNYNNWLREQAPIDYPITALGESIRSDLQKLIPEIEQKSQDLTGLLPTPVKQENEASQEPFEIPGATEAQSMSLERLYEKHSKGKVNTSINLSLKRARQEMETNAKRLKVDSSE
jgi:hypothetical protein